MEIVLRSEVQAKFETVSHCLLPRLNYRLSKIVSEQSSPKQRSRFQELPNLQMRTEVSLKENLVNHLCGKLMPFWQYSGVLIIIYFCISRVIHEQFSLLLRELTVLL